MNRVLVYLTLFVSLSAACGEAKKQDEMSRDDRLTVINELENKVFGEHGDFDAAKMLALVNNYGKFANENPDDDLTPGYLFKAGDISMGLEKATLAIEFFDRLIENYPEFEKVAYCYFLRAFVFENNLNDLVSAKAAYILFIEKYPDHEMTDGAKFSLKNLGKSPEELIREFERQNKATQDES